MAAVEAILMVNRAGRVRFCKYFLGTHSAARDAAVARACLRRDGSRGEQLLPMFRLDNSLVAYRQFSSLFFIAIASHDEAHSQVSDKYAHASMQITVCRTRSPSLSSCRSSSRPSTRTSPTCAS